MKQVVFLFLTMLFLTSVVSFAQVAPPTNLTATVGSSMNIPTITLAWQYDSASNHIKFNIYKKNGASADTVPHFYQIWTTTDKHFVDYSVRPGQTASYYVTAVKDRNTQSAPSNIATATIPAPTFGILSGTLTDDSSGAALKHAMVSFIPAQNSIGSPLSAMTDSNGFFKARVKTGQYFIYCSAMGHISEYYDNAATIHTATSVTVNANDSLGFAIGLAKPTPPAFGIVSGTVTDDASSSPVKNALVSIFPATNSAGTLFSARTDSNGFFKVRVKTGTYKIFSSAYHHISEYYDNATTVQTATAITVNENDSLGFSIGLAPIAPPAFGILSGVVRDDSSGAPLRRAVVYAISVLNSGAGPVSMFTDSNGFFKMRLKVGVYDLYTAAHEHVSEYYDNVSTISNATQITLADGDSLGFDIGLAKVTPPTLYSLTGSVKDSLGNPMRASVTAYRSNRNNGPGDNQRKLFAVTDSLGNFTLRAKANDTLVLFFAPFNNAFMFEYWNNQRTFAAADRIPVNADVTDLNVVLDPLPVYANAVSGFVADSAGTTPLKAYVYAYKKVNNRFNYTKYYAMTDTTTGSYTIASMTPGTYILLGWARGYKASYYRADGAPALNWKQADTLVVTETSLLTANFRLVSLYHRNARTVAHGKVNARSGSALDGAVIYAVDANGTVSGCAVTDVDGSFQIDGLEAGTYSFVSNLASYNDGQTADVTLADNTTTQVDVVLSTDGVTSVSGNTTQIASSYKLSQNYPNPFNPTTMISYTAPTNGFVSVKVYNVLGREVATLVNGEVSAGEHSLTFDASNFNTGVYYVKLEANNFVSMKKMLLIK